MRVFQVRLFVLCTLIFVLASAAAFGERPRIYCIQGATIVPTPGRTIENGTIVLRDGLIEAVGSEVQTPPDAVVIDGEGLWVYAGLIDPVVELAEGLGGSPAKAPGGASTQQQAGPVHPLSLVHPEQSAGDTLLPFSGDRQKRAERLRESGFTTVLAVPESGVFRGFSAAVLLLDETPVSRIILRDHVAQHLSFEHGHFGAGYPSSLMGTAATIRQVLLDTERYTEWTSRYRKNPQGMVRPEHVAAFDALEKTASGDQPVIIHAESVEDVLLAISLAREFDLDASIAAAGNEWEVAEQISRSGRTLILPAALPDKPDVSDDDEALEISIRTMQRYLDAPANAARLHEAGVQFALTTHGLKTLSDFKKNLLKMIENGLPEEAALAALTTVPAELLGISAVAGTLESGKMANVSVFDGPLFAEKSTARHIFVDGIEYRVEEKKKPKGGDPDAVVDPRGEWAVAFEMSGGGTERAWILEGDTASLRGTAETRGGTVTFDDVRLEGNMLTVVFPSRGGRASMELTVVVTGNSFEGKTEFGPRTVGVKGTRTSGPEGGAR